MREAAGLMHAQGNWTLQLLGRPIARDSTGQVVDWPKKAFALVGRLALQSGEAQGVRADLAEFLWPQSTPADARAALRTLLKRMREAGGARIDEILRIGPEWIAFRRDAVNCDVIDAIEKLDAADPAALALTCALFDRPLLDGVSDDASGVGAWISAERQRLRRLTADKAKEALRTHARGMEARFREALALRILDAEPIDEPAKIALARIEKRQRRNLGASHAAARWGASPMPQARPERPDDEARKSPPNAGTIFAPAPARAPAARAEDVASAKPAVSRAFVSKLLEWLSDAEALGKLPQGSATGSSAKRPYVLTVVTQAGRPEFTVVELTNPSGEVVWSDRVSEHPSWVRAEMDGLRTSRVEATGFPYPPAARPMGQGRRPASSGRNPPNSDAHAEAVVPAADAIEKLSPTSAPSDAPQFADYAAVVAMAARAGGATAFERQILMDCRRLLETESLRSAPMEWLRALRAISTMREDFGSGTLPRTPDRS